MPMINPNEPTARPVSVALYWGCVGLGAFLATIMARTLDIVSAYIFTGTCGVVSLLFAAYAMGLSAREDNDDDDESDE